MLIFCKLSHLRTHTRRIYILRTIYNRAGVHASTHARDDLLIFFYILKKNRTFATKFYEMKRVFFAIFAAFIFAGCSNNEIKNFAETKILEYYGQTVSDCTITKCDYSFDSPIIIHAAIARVEQAKADLACGMIDRDEYRQRVDEWTQRVDRCAMSWRLGEFVDTLRSAETRTMHRCTADTISFFILTDKDGKTPLYSTMDVQQMCAAFAENL